MATPQVINEVASVMNAVISVIAGSMLKLLPVLVFLLMGLAVVDVLVAASFEDKSNNQTLLLSDRHQPGIQLNSNAEVDTSLISVE